MFTRIALIVMLVCLVGGVADAALLDLSGAPKGMSTEGWGLNVNNAFDAAGGTRSSTVPNTLPGWIWVDLGDPGGGVDDWDLNSVSIDYQLSGAQDYTVRVMTKAEYDAGGDVTDLADYLTVATMVGATEMAPRGNEGVYDVINFAGASFTHSGPGAGVINVAAPTGRYLMAHFTLNTDPAWSNISIWDIDVDAASTIPEPGTLTLLLLGSFGFVACALRRRR